jgi:nucleoside-diphosphate-sugar epimerase
MSIFSNQLKRDKPIYIYGDGKQMRSFSHVEDCVEAFIIAYSKRDEITSGEVFNIGPDDGTEITYALYEKRKEDAKKEESLPKLQKSLSLFPDFEEEFPRTDREPSLDEIYNAEIADAPLSEITIRDLAAIMLMKPVSARPWLNDIINKTKSEI